MSASYTANGAPRCRAYIEPRHGERSCPQCSRSATHVLPGNPERVWCGQHARFSDRPMTADERAALSRTAVPA